MGEHIISGPGIIRLRQFVFKIIKKHKPLVICLGYDQAVNIQELRKVFFGKIIRLKPHKEHIYKSSKDEYYKVLILSIAACLVAFLVNGLTEASLYYARVAMIFSYFIGFALALERFTDARKV